MDLLGWFFKITHLVFTLKPQNEREKETKKNLQFFSWISQIAAWFQHSAKKLFLKRKCTAILLYFLFFFKKCSIAWYFVKGTYICDVLLCNCIAFMPIKCPQFHKSTKESFLQFAISVVSLTDLYLSNVYFYQIFPWILHETRLWIINDIIKPIIQTISTIINLIRKSNGCNYEIIITYLDSSLMFLKMFQWHTIMIGYHSNSIGKTLKFISSKLSSKAHFNI